MALESRAKLAQGEQLLARKIAYVCHRGIAHRADVAIAQKQSVSFLPSRVFGIVMENVEIERGKNVCHSQRACAMARACCGKRTDNVLSDCVCQKFEFFLFSNAFCWHLFSPRRIRMMWFIKVVLCTRATFQTLSLDLISKLQIRKRESLPLPQPRICTYQDEPRHQPQR